MPWGLDSKGIQCRGTGRGPSYPPHRAWTMELVRTETEEIHTQLFHIEGHVSRSLDGVGVKEGLDP